MKNRKYKDKYVQRAYDGTVSSYRSGARGWLAPGVHGLWRDDGSRFRGASMISAFWNGYDGLTLNGGRAMYRFGSLNYGAYMAGRDIGRAVSKEKMK